MKERQIVLNRIITPDGTVMESNHVHDYKEYTDTNGDVYVIDGGNDYLRRSVNTVPYTEWSVYSDAPYETLRYAVKRGGRGKDGTEPLKWVPLAIMSNKWLENCIDYNAERGMDDSFSSEMYRKELEYREKFNIYIGD